MPPPAPPFSLFHDKKKRKRGRQEQVTYANKESLGQPTYYKPSRDLCGRLRTYEVRRKVNIAVVELFAGLRTTHEAAKYVNKLNIVLSHAADKCPFANHLAKKNRIKEKLFLDVCNMCGEWAE